MTFRNFGTAMKAASRLATAAGLAGLLLISSGRTDTLLTGGPRSAGTTVGIERVISEAAEIDNITSKVLGELKHYQSYNDNREVLASTAASLIAALAKDGLTSQENFLIKNLPLLLIQSYKQNGAGNKGLDKLVHAITNDRYSQFSVKTEKGLVNVLYLAVPGHSQEETLATIRQIREFIPALSPYSALGFPEHLLVYDGFGPVNIGKGQLVAIGNLINYPPSTKAIGHELAHTIHSDTPGWLKEGWAEYLSIRAQEDVSQRPGMEESLWDLSVSIEGFNHYSLNKMENISPAKKYANDDSKYHVAPFIFLRELHRIIGPDAMRALSIRLSEQEERVRNLARATAHGNAAAYEAVEDCAFLEAVVAVTQQYAPSKVDYAGDHVVKNGIGELPKCD